MQHCSVKVEHAPDQVNDRGSKVEERDRGNKLKERTAQQNQLVVNSSSAEHSHGRRRDRGGETYAPHQEGRVLNGPVELRLYDARRRNDPSRIEEAFQMDGERKNS